jgi:branched-chain amino acid transport system permease protein
MIAFVVRGALNFAIEKIAYRPLRNSLKLAPLITAIGMSLLLQTLAMMDLNYKPYPTLRQAGLPVVGGDHRDRKFSFRYRRCPCRC